MKKHISILLSLLLAIGPLTACSSAKEISNSPSGVLSIREKGNFSAGGTVATSDGMFDPMQPWMVPQGGQTRHGDHADVFYQIPAQAGKYPMVFLHGYGQSRRSW